MKFKQSRGMLFLKERGIAFCLRHRLVKLRMKLLEKNISICFSIFC